MDIEHLNTKYFETLLMDISNICNLRCPLCARTKLKDKVKLQDTNLSFEILEEILIKFPSITKIELGHVMSEPLLHPNIIEIIRHLKGRYINIFLPTNGSVQKDSVFWKEFMELLDENDQIVWAIDGLSQETYQQYRIGGKLDSVLKNFFQAYQFNPRVQHNIQTIEFKHNINELFPKDIKGKTTKTTKTSKNFHKFKEEILKRIEYFGLIPGNLNIYTIPCCENVNFKNKSTNEVEPLWDKNKWEEIKDSPFLKNQTIRCSSIISKDIYIDHVGRIRLCGDHYTDNPLDTEAPTIEDSIEKIDSYIKNTYENRFKNKICNYTCGAKSKLKRNIYGIPIEGKI